MSAVTQDLDVEIRHWDQGAIIDLPVELVCSWIEDQLRGNRGIQLIANIILFLSRCFRGVRMVNLASNMALSFPLIHFSRLLLRLVVVYLPPRGLKCSLCIDSFILS